MTYDSDGKRVLGRRIGGDSRSWRKLRDHREIGEISEND